MATERNVVDFKIHNLTEEQFQELKAQGKIDPNAFYCTPDETVVKFEELGERIDTANEQINTKQDIATAVNYDNITNCITEIPQDIKLELADGALTLKADSKVYVPNGAGVFNVITTNNDITATPSTNGTHLIGFAPEFGTITTYINAVSGTTEPTTLSNGLTWYDTANNVIKRAWAGSWQASLFSLPVAVVTISNGAITSIDQVFNGFGYIGSTLFALPGVKGLVPNGRNSDGTLKNTTFAVNSVLKITGTETNKVAIRLKADEIATGDLNYDETNNYNIHLTSGGIRTYAIVGYISRTSGVINSLSTKTAFHAVDYSEITNIFNLIYPVGAIYIGTQSTCPMSIAIPGSSWSLVSAGRALWTGTGSNGNTTIAAGLPNITGKFATSGFSQSGSGVFIYTQPSAGNQGWDGYGTPNGQWDFNATRSSSVYGNSTTVQPPAYVVNVWRRTA